MKKKFADNTESIRIMKEDRKRLDSYRVSPDESYWRVVRRILDSFEFHNSSAKLNQGGK